MTDVGIEKPSFEISDNESVEEVTIKNRFDSIHKGQKTFICSLCNENFT